MCEVFDILGWLSPHAITCHILNPPESSLIRDVCTYSRIDNERYRNRLTSLYVFVGISVTGGSLEVYISGTTFKIAEELTH